MCMRIRKREPNPSKTLWVYKIFTKHAYLNEYGLWAQIVNFSYNGKQGYWLKTKRPGFHAFLTRRSASQQYSVNCVVKRVCIRNIIGYGNYYSLNINAVRALEMWIPTRGQKRPRRPPK